MTGLPITVASVAGLIMKATMVLSLALLLAWLARRGSARTLHLLWTTTFAVLLALPALSLLGPAWTLPILPARELPAELPALGADDALTASSRPEPREATGSPAVSGSPLPGSSGPARGNGSAPFGPAGIAFLIWALGCGAALTSLGVGVLRFRSLVRLALPVRNPAWIQSATAIRRRLHIRTAVRLLSNTRISTPMIGGVRQPAILLPASAEAWPPERRAVVLAHELVHVRRRDPLRQLLSRAVVSLYWFHPLSWLASRLATAASEQSCDEEVLALGAGPSEYARHLFSLASEMAGRPAPLALPLAQQSQLEHRMMSILRPCRPRYSRIRTSAAMAVVGVVGILAACARPVPRDPPASPASQVEILPLSPATPANAASEPAPPPAPPTEPAPRLAPQSEPAPPVAPAPEAIALQEPECGRGNWAGLFRDREQLAFQVSVDGMWLCMRSRGNVTMTEDGTAIRDMDGDSRLLLESRTERLHRLVITSGSGGLEHDWRIDDRSQPFDAEAREWRDRMLTVLARSRETQEIRGQEASLRGEIASHRGQVASLRGEIASHRGQVASLHGRIASHEGHVAAMRGRMASERGHVAVRQGEIAAYRGQIAASRFAAQVAETPETQEALAAEISEAEARIREVAVEIERYDVDARRIEREIEAYDLDGKVQALRRAIDEYDLDERAAEIEAEIDDYDLDGKLREIESQIEQYDLDGKIREIEARIEELDADRRTDEIERSLEDDIASLRRLIG